MIFQYFSRQILFSRTFQENPLHPSTFQACANPVYWNQPSLSFLHVTKLSKPTTSKSERGLYHGWIQSGGGGGGGGETGDPEPPWKITKIYGFFAILVQIPWKNHKTTNPGFNVYMAFRPRADDGPFIAVFVSSIPLSPKKTKLEDLKVLRRSPDLLNNCKTGQGQLQLIMKHILFYHIWGLQPFWSNNLNNLTAQWFLRKDV